MNFNPPLTTIDSFIEYFRNVLILRQIPLSKHDEYCNMLEKLEFECRWFALFETIGCLERAMQKTELHINSIVDWIEFDSDVIKLAFYIFMSFYTSKCSPRAKQIAHQIHMDNCPDCSAAVEANLNYESRWN